MIAAAATCIIKEYGRRAKSTAKLRPRLFSCACVSSAGRKNAASMVRLSFSHSSAYPSHCASGRDENFVVAIDRGARARSHN